MKTFRTIAIGTTVLALVSSGGWTAHASALTHAAAALFGTDLVPAHAIPVVTGALKAGETSASAVPVVVLPYASAVKMAGPIHVPTSVLASVPQSAARSLSAYLFPLNQWDLVYLVGPRGMKGMATLGADGSDDITLRNSHAVIELNTPGGSPYMAQSMVDQFFPSAGEALNRDLSGTKSTPWARADLLQHASVKLQYNQRLALFAFHSTNDRSVYGYSFYQHAYSGAFGMAAQFVYSADASEAGMAPWVMRSALSLLIGVGEPQLAGPPVPKTTVLAHNGTHTYSIPVPKGLSAYGETWHTARGLAWIGQPAWIDTGTGMRTDVPAGLISINLTPLNAKVLCGATMRTLTMLAPMQPGVYTDSPLYTSVYLAGTAGSDWLLYSTSYASVGMNQPDGNDLYAVTMRQGLHAPVRIASFLDAGGYFFSFGTYGDHVIYDQANDLDPHGTTNSHLWLVDLQSMRRTKIPASALHGTMVSVKIGGKQVWVMLKQA